jgi:hypothetical protein
MHNLLGSQISSISQSIKSYKGVIEKETILSINMDNKSFSSSPILKPFVKQSSSDQVDAMRMSG